MVMLVFKPDIKLMLLSMPNLTINSQETVIKQQI